MRFAVIVNEGAGSAGDGRSFERRAAEILRAQGHELVEVPDGAFAARLEAACRGPAETLLVGGGDGSINLAARLVTGRGKALAILPLGTANLLARDLGIPLDPAGAVEALGRSGPKAIDLGEVNGRLFVSKCMIGATSRISHMRKRLKRRIGSRAWVGLLAAFLVLLRPTRRLALVAESDEGRQRLRVRVLAVLNNEYDEAPGRVFARSRLDRGVLTIYTVKRPSPVGFLRIVAGMVAGHWKKASFLSYRTVHEVAIHSRHKLLHVTIDGDLHLMAPPLRFSVRPQALTVMVPRASGRTPR